NRGRDIGAFLTGFARELARYDIIGHLHGKRSPHTGDLSVGGRGRGCLWENLLGGIYPMVDTVVSRFGQDPGLGLAFAEDPHLSDWDLNRSIAEGLAQRMGLAVPLPLYFDFPIGTMFWARPVALAPLFNRGFDWNAYPADPAP